MAPAERLQPRRCAVAEVHRQQQDAGEVDRVDAEVLEPVTAEEMVETLGVLGEAGQLPEDLTAGYEAPAIVDAAAGLGDVTIQTRKTYVSLVTPRRTFARIQPTTKSRVDLALRLEGRKPGGRLQASKIHETMRLQISLTSVDDIDSEVLDWLQEAYDQNL